MPDCSSVEMIIGGEIKDLETFTGLIEALREDGAGIEWCGCGEDGDMADHIIESSKNGLQLVVNEHEVPWGEFDFTEDFCKENGLSFARHDGGHYSWDATIVAYDGRSKKDYQFFASSETFMALVSAEMIRRAMQCGDTELVSLLADMEFANNLNGMKIIVSNDVISEWNDSLESAQ